MREEKKKRLTRFTFLLNGAIFILSGISLLSDGKEVLGVIQILAGASNILMILPAERRLKIKIYYIILSFNILVALATSLDYFIAGKNYIQYAWLAVAVLSAIAMIVQHRKKLIANQIV